MEYKITTPKDKNYPKKLKERLGKECPKLYYNASLELLDKFTMAVISADAIGGVGLMAANQLLFTIRDYAMNYIGAWQSVMETEIFRLGLWKKCHNTVTLVSAKGLAAETYDSFLLDRFYPPMDKFPEREEYFRRAQNGELLMLSVTEPEEKRHLHQNIIKRNWILCNLGDIIFIPYGVKGSKTYTVAKKIAASGLPAFTTDCEENKALFDIGIPKYSRKTVTEFLEKHGAPLWKEETKPEEIINYATPVVEPSSFVKEPKLQQSDFLEGKKKSR